MDNTVDVVHGSVRLQLFVVAGLVLGPLDSLLMDLKVHDWMH